MNICDKILLLSELIRCGAEFEIAIDKCVCGDLVYKIKDNMLMVKNKTDKDFKNPSIWSMDLLLDDIIEIRRVDEGWANIDYSNNGYVMVKDGKIIGDINCDIVGCALPNIDTNANFVTSGGWGNGIRSILNTTDWGKNKGWD